MLRQSFLRLFTLVESRTMFLDAKGNSLASHSTATLTQTLQVLAEHYRHKDTALTHAVLQRLLSLDSTDADSETIASFHIYHNSSNNDNTDTQVLSTSSSHLILQVMALYANDIVVREGCCRCIANMCQLTHMPHSSHGDYKAESHDSPMPTSENRNTMPVKKGIADMLVEQGAIELVLGTLAMSSRLSARGRTWAALAALNLVCLSENGAQRAAKAKGESVLSDFVVATTTTTTNTTNIFTNETSTNGINALNNNNNNDNISYKSCQGVAIDAALGALTRLLTAEADDNAAGIQYRYEEVSYGTVEAIAQGLMWLSESFIAEMQSGGDNGVSRTGYTRRDGVVFFPTAVPSQQSAILAFLPPLHKAWMALKSISSSSKNLSIVYEALYRPGDGNGLRKVMDAVLLLGVCVEGLAAVGAEEELRLQSNMLLCAMEAFADLTATRKDLDARTLAGATTTTTIAGNMVNSSHDNDATVVEREENEMGTVDVSAVIPTEAALSVSESLAAGVVCTIAVSTIVRLHTTHSEAMANKRSSTICTGDLTHHCRHDTIGLVYENTVFDLLARCVVVLANLAGQDIAVASLNTIAALHALLQDAADIIERIGRQYHHAPCSLFAKKYPQPKEEAKDKEIQFLLTQQCALAGQVYAVLWGVLRRPAGTRTVRELCVLETVRRVQTAVESLCDSANVVNEEDVTSDNTTTTATPTTTTAATTDEPATASSVSAAEDTMRRLIPLGRQVLRCLELADTADKERGATEKTNVTG